MVVALLELSPKRTPIYVEGLVFFHECEGSTIVFHQTLDIVFF